MLYATTTASILYYSIDGYDYYSATLDERPHHESYRNLKPGGFRGHGFGVIGSTMLVLLLAYSVRKRMGLLRNTGNMGHWLNIHIYMGISGPLLIILHSSLKLNGLVSVSFWAMIAVALSGVLGRYIYGHIPRTVDGNELSISDVKSQLEDLSLKIQTSYRIDDRVQAEIDQLVRGDRTSDAGMISALSTLLFSGSTKRKKIKRIRKSLRITKSISKQEQKTLLSLIKQKFVLERRIYFWNAIHEMFHYWHVIHKPFAIIMYVIMLVHVGIAIWLGYTWIL